MVRLSFIATFVIAIILTQTAIGREKLSNDLPVLIFADEINYDDELGTVIAKGKVEITQGKRTLLANTVSYNQKTDTVSASGNIILHEPSGQVIFAEFVELTEELKNGIIDRIQILLEDKSRFAANSAVRRDGNKIQMYRALYSPCDLCEKEPEKPPLWQLKAERIDHSQKDREIRYKDVFLEMWGFPIAYAPYLSHPDPTVDRKSGFLAPSFGTSSDVGAFIRLPYFITMGDERDATITPIYTKDEGLVLSGNYRQRLVNGKVAISGSIAEAQRNEGDPDNSTIKNDRVRGHITIDGEYHLDDTWRSSFDTMMASDRTYLRKFNFFKLNPNTLRSNVMVEGFRQRNYIAANAYWFQDLRTGTTEDQPVVAPIIDFNHMGEADRFGGRWQLDGNFRALFRDNGTDSQRVSITPGYAIGRTWNTGLVTNAAATVQSDGYWLRDIVKSDGTKDNAFEGRLLPRLAIDARLPFARVSAGLKQVIEPIAIGILAPNGSNSSNIPDEEGTVFELDDTNLLSINRFAGLDSVDSGSRIIYGAKFGLYGPNSGNITGFVGQSYRLSKDRDLTSSKLLETDFTDYVGRIDIKPNEYTDILYRFKFAESNFSNKSSSIGFSFGPTAFKLNGEYLFFEEGSTTVNTEGREELVTSFSSQINQYWSASIGTHRDLTKDGGSLRHSLRARYSDECFTFESVAIRSFTRDADIQPESQILFRLIFKNLGQVESNAG
ncbi:MAG: hypothetical protein CMP14_08660 [Rickettsiales bacterium]|nr:hypothetical protein [Rickettsiales bacterium]